jgi:hypothetical protein
MPTLKTVVAEGCPEDRSYCSDFDPSGKKCKYYDICEPSINRKKEMQTK